MRVLNTLIFLFAEKQTKCVRVKVQAKREWDFSFPNSTEFFNVKKDTFQDDQKKRN